MDLWWTLAVLIAVELELQLGAAAPSARVSENGASSHLPEVSSVHRTLVSYLDNHPDIRSLTVRSPIKTVRRRKTTWTMDVWTLGENGEGHNMLVMKPLGSYDKASWNGTFPCVLLRGARRTACRGPLPEGAGSEVWKLVLEETGPARWDGRVASPPRTPAGESEPVVGQTTCGSLSDLVLARAIQRGGRYAGEANVTCQTTSTFFYVTVDGPGIHFQMQINAAPGEGYENGGSNLITRRVSWESGVDSLGRLVVSSDGNPSVAYAREDLSGEREVKLSGRTYASATYADTDDPDRRGEPRLCGLVAANAACSIMGSLSGDELTTLGAVTGFNMQRWAVGHNGTVFTRGYVLGTHGVLSGQYTATASDPRAPSWTEVPLQGADGCPARLYAASNCLGLPGGAPAVSAYQTTAVVHHPFPETTCETREAA